MTGLISGDPQDSATLRELGSDAVQSSAGEVAGATFANGFFANPTPRLIEAQGRFDVEGRPNVVADYWRDHPDPRTAGSDVDAMAAERGAAPAPIMLTPEEANRKYGIKGDLTFDRPISDQTASALHDLHHAEMLRQDTIARRGDSLLTGGAARLGIGFAAGLLDPTNLAAAFIPIGGEARVAGMLDTAGGALARAGIRAGYGAAQGAVGQAALEPINYLLDSSELQDWTAAQALRNIAFGAALGGGLHAVGGAIGDRISGRGASPLAAGMEALGPEAREATLGTAVAQTVDGRPVDTAPLVGLAAAKRTLDTTDLRSAYADRLAARGDTAGGNYASYTPQGQRVELRPEVVEMDDLIASHTADGTVNPAFPHEAGMQPRDRSSAASQAQITEMASRLEPERLGPSPEASTGAPIVNAGNIVESGNGRVLALRRVYGDPGLVDQANAYRTFLTARGHDVGEMRMPVLIGRRVTEMAPEDARTFVRGANERATLGMNAAEQARLDAGRAGNAVQAYRPGPIGGRENQAFVGAFMAQVPAEERANMVLGNGQLSSQGEARIRMALLAHAYGDALGPTLERVLNGDVEHMKGVAGALTDEAAAWSQMRGAAASGEIPAGLDITPAIGEAVQLLDRARSSGTPIATLIAQMDMLDRPSPAAEGLLRLMFRDDAMRQPVARAKLAELLDRYVEQAMQAKPGAGLFGEPETSAADILRAIAGDNDRVRAAANAMAETQTAARDLVDAARHGGADPEDTRTAAEAAEAGKRDHAEEGPEAEAPTEAAKPAAPTVTGPIAKEITDLESFVAAAREAGTLDAADEAALRAAEGTLGESADLASAYQQAAMCLLGGNA